MGRFFLKLLAFLMLAGFAGLIGFAYLGNLSPETSEIIQPVTLDAQ